MNIAARVATLSVYDVPAEWTHRAYLDDAGYRAKYEASIRDPEGFWAEEAKRIDWFKAPTRIKNTNFGPDNVAIRWFEDGVTNVGSEQEMLPHTGSSWHRREREPSTPSCLEAVLVPTPHTSVP